MPQDNFLSNLKDIIWYSDTNGMTMQASKNDITLVDLNSDIVVRNSYKGINVWSNGTKNVDTYENAEYQLFILRASFDHEDTEQSMLYPLLSALRLAQQPFNSIVDEKYKNLSTKTLVVLLIDVKDNYANRSRIKEFASYYIGRCENFYISACYKYNSTEYTYEIFEEDNNTFGKIFPLLPVSSEGKKFSFQPLYYSELTTIRNVNEQKNYLDIAIARLSDNLKKKISEEKNKLYNASFGDGKATKREKRASQNLREEEYKSDYNNTIEVKLKTLTYLAQIIWLTVLRDIAETSDDDGPVNNHIIEVNSNKSIVQAERKFKINQDLITSTYLAAIEYADGISQILENSVNHSREQIGFFSLRTYYVDFDAPPSKAVDCARYRKTITQKYRIAGNDLFEHCQYLIEFIIIDYAIPMLSNGNNIGIGDRKNYYKQNVRGIVDVFNENNINEGAKLNTLEEVFDFKSNNVKQIVGHLGLKLFRELIEENGGGFSVISPRRDGNKNYAFNYHRYNKTSSKQKEESLENKVRGFTKYSVILPIREQTSELQKGGRINRSIVVNDSVFDGKDIQQVEISKPKNETFSANISKENIIEALKDHYKNEIISKTKNSENIVVSVISHNLTNTYMEECEHLAKISLLLQDDLCHENNYPSQRRFLALNFFSDNNELADQAIGFFLRIYASFYKKADGGRIPALGRSQLALFATVKGKSTQYVLNICGESVEDLRAVAEHFIYSGFPFALKQANQLRFLVGKTDKKGDAEDKNTVEQKNAIELFPYDLFVCDKLNKQDGVFISSIKRELNRELGAKPENHIKETESEDHIRNVRNGICIKSNHVALSTGIHLDTFYRAELLFYNNFIIKNFAILIARDLICKLNQNDHSCDAKHNGIVVIGYENYSHVLMEQIAYYLEKHAESLGIGYILGNAEYSHVTYCTFAGQIDIVNGIKTRVVPKFRLQHLVQCADKSFTNIQMADLFIKGDDGKDNSPLFVIVEPIATTSNTILQIRRALRHFSDSKVSSINYSLIISAPKSEASLEENYKDGLEIRSQYWSGSKKIVKPKIDKFGSIQLKRDYSNEVEQDVKYLIHVGSNWYRAHSCPMCDKDVALDWVDKTSTTTYLIHELLGSNRRGITYALQTANDGQKKMNNDRIGFLRGNIAYGHTQTQSNHFLFNLDLKHTLESNIKLEIGADENKVTCREDVEKWLQNVPIDSTAFNVLISPLHERNSPFVRMVSEFALRQNIRFIHFDVSATPREAVRTDFVYVADEISTIINDNSHNKVNIYYCDDSNVSGESMHRAMLIMKTLLNEVHLAERDYNRINLFKGIILFVNRSSYESLQQFVNDPDTDVYSYINLGVPNYNTHQGVCYDCSFIKKLELEKKRTVSSHDICDIDRLIQKHRLLTVTQFWEFIKSEVFTSGKYVKWLKSWRLINPKDEVPEEIKNILTALQTKTSEFLPENLNSLNLKELNDIIKNIDEIRLNDLISPEQDAKTRENIWQFFKNRVIADRYFMRLLCSHKLQCELEHVSENISHYGDLYKKTLSKVLDLLIEEKHNITGDKQYSDTPRGKQQALVHFCELLISYIKILSREQLVRFYHIRQVAIDIMIFLLLACIKGVSVAINNACKSERVTKNDTDIFDKYRKILDGLIFSKLDNQSEGMLAKQENSLNAGSQAFLVISLIKKIANLDSVFFMRNVADDISLKIDDFPNIWGGSVNKYFGINDYNAYYDTADRDEFITLTTIPSFEYFVNVYQNALRWTLLTTHDDDGKSYRVEDVYNIDEEEDDE